jgi:adenine phosphoribosyltransferase
MTAGKMLDVAISPSSNEVRRRMRETFVWRGDDKIADLSAWWADADLLAMLGPALAGLHPHASPTLVLAPEAVGFALGPLTAVAAGAGFLEMRRELAEQEIGDQVLLRSTSPDYRDRTVEWGVRRRWLRPGQRVLFVDDWVDTAATVGAARRLVEDCGASWMGAAVLVDSTSPVARRDLNLRGLLRERELW